MVTISTVIVNAKLGYAICAKEEPQEKNTQFMFHLPEQLYCAMILHTKL